MALLGARSSSSGSWGSGSWGLGLVLWLLAPVAVHGAVGGTTKARLSPVQASVDAVAGLRVELSPRCGAQVRAELAAGQRRNDACGRDREAIGRALVRRRDAFGFVERRAVDLVSLRMVLGEGRRCRQWPLRSPERDVLRRNDVDAAGCRPWRYEGEVSLVLVDRAGGRHEPLPPLRTDRDGHLELRFTALDHALQELGAGTLYDYARIELGEGAWAGHVDLEQLLRLRADWHLAWVLRGRGAPGLFVAGHPGHAGADAARTLTAEGLLERQARDYERVEAGELPARAFLDRYPRSPHRRRVEASMRAHALPAPARDD